MLLNLRSLIFGLTPFGWLRSITANPSFLTEILFLIYTFLFMPLFFQDGD
jgi:hypothetical protein